MATRSLFRPLRFYTMNEVWVSRIPSHFWLLSFCSKMSLITLHVFEIHVLGDDLACVEHGNRSHCAYNFGVELWV
ncbi:hypothetical protein PIB30_046880 [Stylosanthes scabra]|uniref:Uncharacterized protein n=1 Tax=Stylosanthes scabra TaxID=79078 RepID=A0ABU6SGP5_9FABA|nr:hypothetical protein [Stylosanthes scabra]